MAEPFPNLKWSDTELFYSLHSCITCMYVNFLWNVLLEITESRLVIAGNTPGIIFVFEGDRRKFFHNVSFNHSLTIKHMSFTGMDEKIQCLKADEDPAECTPILVGDIFSLWTNWRYSYGLPSLSYCGKHLYGMLWEHCPTVCSTPTQALVPICTWKFCDMTPWQSHFTPIPGPHKWDPWFHPVYHGRGEQQPYHLFRRFDDQRKNTVSMTVFEIRPTLIGISIISLTTIPKFSMELSDIWQ